jgi:RNA polymerase sigma-70 factor (ECF subfamily)
LDAQQEFLRLFLRYEAELKAFIGALVRDRHARDDLFQEVALILWEKFPGYDRTRSFGAWGRGIAANKMLQRWEKTGRVPTPLSPQAIQSVLDAYERTESAASARADALELCLERLAAKSRRLLAWRYEHSMSLDEIAGRLGHTLNAVYKALSRIRQRLQECIERRLTAGDMLR